MALRSIGRTDFLCQGRFILRRRRCALISIIFS
jgi:hypothetical protein